MMSAMQRIPSRIDAGELLAAAGAVLLLVSLFVDWFDPGISAWTAFEALDLVLAATALVAIAAIVGRVAVDWPRWPLPALGGLALVVVASQLLQEPPAVEGRSLEGGAWLALAGSALILAGAVLSQARITLVVETRARARRVQATDARPGERSPTDEAAGQPTQRLDSDPPAGA
jgi:hypothetical protein